MINLYDLKQYVTDVMITYPSLKDECLEPVHKELQVRILEQLNNLKN